jgi:hypothetical protein
MKKLLLLLSATTVVASLLTTTSVYARERKPKPIVTAGPKKLEMVLRPVHPPTKGTIVAAVVAPTVRKAPAKKPAPRR